MIVSPSDQKCCKICNNTKNIECFGANKSYKNGLENICKFCRSQQRRKDKNYNKKMNEYYSTLTGRANRMFNGAKRRAIEKNIEFTITLEFVKERLEKGICERTGIRFEFITSHSLFAPSIDRIKNNLGYTKDNVQIVCCAYNMGKKNMSDEDFESFILKAAEFIASKNK